MEDTTDVSIPISLFKQLEEKIKATRFESVSGYVTFILQSVIAETEQPRKVFSEKEEDKVKERLRALGYIE